MDYLQQVSLLHQRNLLDARHSLQASARTMSDLYLAMEGKYFHYTIGFVENKFEKKFFK